MENVIVSGKLISLLFCPPPLYFICLKIQGMSSLPSNGNHFSSIQESKGVHEEIFNGPTPVFVASFITELFTCLLGHSQRKQAVGA